MSKKEKAAPQNGTTKLEHGQHITKATKVPALLELAAAHLLDASARQPELGTELQGRFFIAAGLLDGAFIIATGIGLWFATANPFKG